MLSESPLETFVPFFPPAPPLCFRTGFVKDFFDRLGNFAAHTPRGGDVVPIFGAEALRLFAKDAREQFRDESAPLSMAALAKSKSMAIG